MTEEKIRNAFNKYKAIYEKVLPENAVIEAVYIDVNQGVTFDFVINDDNFTWNNDSIHEFTKNLVDDTTKLIKDFPNFYIHEVFTSTDDDFYSEDEMLYWKLGD